MTSSHSETIAAVGISVSESPDLQSLGLSDGHLRDAMAEIALHVLASGRSLAMAGICGNTDLQTCWPSWWGAMRTIPGTNEPSS